ncbi:MAG: MFS transporter [Rhodospirillaceae bacterium]|jgi:MFS family permease|nr:MFS transporter [Rhodospirillaceae bacterium]MBT5459124.1 MFS transporter [Rhodospirillaceae bacterium]
MMATDQATPLPLRTQMPVYGTAFFSNSIPDLVLVVMQLWLIKLGTPLFVIGLVFGARYVGPLLFAIHGGSMMDRLGTRRVMIFFAAIMIVVPFVYPVAPWVSAVVILQLISGMADSLGWVGTQTLTGQVLRGNPTYTGRLIFATRVGTFIGPPVAGAAWDLFGPWGGFISLSLWGVGLMASVWALPANALSPPTAAPQPLLRAVTPRLTDYIAAFRLFSIPLMAVALFITLLRQFGSGMQNSFYAVYMDGIGMSGTLIGFLVAATGLTGVAALATGWLVQRLKEFNLLIWTTIISIASIGIVPFFTDFIPLFIASSLRGATMAISVVIIVSLIARTVGPEEQGRAMGLRTTCNQSGNVCIPVVMGTLAHFFGLEVAFYAVGVLGVALLLIAARWVRRIETPPV